MISPPPGWWSCIARAIATAARSSADSSPTWSFTSTSRAEPVEHRLDRRRAPPGCRSGGRTGRAPGSGRAARSPRRSWSSTRPRFWWTTDSPAARGSSGWTGSARRPAVHRDGTAGIGRVDPGQDLDQGRLAAAVLADEAVQLPGRDAAARCRAVPVPTRRSSTREPPPGGARSVPLRPARRSRGVPSWFEFLLPVRPVAEIATGALVHQTPQSFSKSPGRSRRRTTRPRPGPRS